MFGSLLYDSGCLIFMLSYLILKLSIAGRLILKHVFGEITCQPTKLVGWHVRQGHQVGGLNECFELVNDLSAFGPGCVTTPYIILI